MAPSKHGAPGKQQENEKQPQPQPQRPQPQSRNSSSSGPSYLTYPVSHVVSGLYRRLTEPAPEPSVARPAATDPMSSSAVFTPPRRHASPFQPPPLTPLTLNAPSTASNLLLTRSLAEEIRLLVPPRLQLVDSWQLVYSLDKDGSSLSTLYGKCEEFSHQSQRAGYLLVVRDSSSTSTTGGGTVFGAYLTDPPHPASSYYGTGECFLWRASTLPTTPIIQLDSTNGGYAEAKNRNEGDQEGLHLAGLPPPPSGDTLNVPVRNTTFRGENRSGTSTPDRIRFKAFPYSGVNDYMIFCETGFLSVGGGDGRYGLWLDDSFETGVSSPCLTFGNEPLSEEGTKFDVLGVEVWYIG